MGKLRKNSKVVKELFQKDIECSVKGQIVTREYAKDVLYDEKYSMIFEGTPGKKYCIKSCGLYIDILVND